MASEKEKPTEKVKNKNSRTQSQSPATTAAAAATAAAFYALSPVNLRRAVVERKPEACLRLIVQRLPLLPFNAF